MMAIYYISKKFTVYEAKYTLHERMCCALTWVAHELKHYLSLNYIFQKLMPTGRFEKRQILFTEFEIIYVRRTTMKAQALEDH